MEEQNIVTDELTSKKGSKKGLFIVIGAAIVLAISAFLLSNKFASSKSIFIKSINKEYASFEKKLDKYTGKNKESKPILMSNEVKFKIDIDKSLIKEEEKAMIDEINKLSIKNQIGVDEKNKNMLLTLDALYDNSDLINLGAYLTNDKMYVELKNLYDKYIEIPFEEVESYVSVGDSINLNKDDLKYVASKTKDALLNNLDSKKFKKSTEKVTVNKKDVKLNKITYTFTAKAFDELLVKALEDVKDDSKYIKIIAKTAGLKESEVKEQITELIKNLKEVIKANDFDDDTKINISIFTKGINNSYAGLEFELLSDNGNYKVSYYINGKDKEVTFKQDKETLVRITMSDNKATIKLTAEGQEIVINVTKKEEKNKTTYDYDVNLGMKVNGKVVIEKIKENKDGTGESKITVTASMLGLVNLEVTDTIKLEYKDKIDMPKITNSVKYDELTENDYNKIMSKLYENKALVTLIQKLSSYQGM